jgi:hypothetical protein
MFGRPKLRIDGPAAGTYRTSRKAAAAIYEDVTVDGVTVRIAYPAKFDAEQIEAARIIAQPTAQLAETIRRRFQNKSTSGTRRAKNDGSHVISGGMWNNLRVRMMKGKARVDFYGQSEEWRRNGKWRFKPGILNALGQYDKRDARGRFLPIEEGDREWWLDPSEPIVRAFTVKNGKRVPKKVPNRIKAWASSESDRKSILTPEPAEIAQFQKQAAQLLQAWIGQTTGSKTGLDVQT